MLLHGTFSHTEGAFGGLRSQDFETFARAYGDRLLALEHATLGVSPAQNALQAAEALPEGARLHLVSHSRGGLVGDVLALAGADAWPGTDLYARWGQSNHPDVAALTQLRATVREKGIRVERFARVASPARGTTLASRRLDLYAKYLFHIFWAIPGLRETGAAAVIEKFLLTLLDKRTDPHLVPGLEAMMPESVFIKWLNTAPPIDDGMAAIAGDVEGGGLFKRLKLMAADLFYRDDHDFVVNTSAMAGGVPRVTPRQAFFQGPAVTHSSYFAREDTRRAVVGWLAATGPQVPGFAAPGGPPLQSRAPAAPRGSQGRVALVPDVFGSVLESEGTLVWPSVAALSGGIGEILSSTRSFVASGLTGAYDGLAAALGAHFDVLPLGYDWTVPASETATPLRHALEGLLADGRPVHVVGVGAGALRLLAALKDQDLRRRITAAGGQVLLVSPPLAGSWRVATTLKGHDELSARLALLDPTRDAAHVGEALAGLRGLAELLPDGAPFADDLLEAIGQRPGLEALAVGDRVLLGSRAPTVVSWSADKGRFLTTTQGDGQVSTTPVVIPGSTVHWSALSHAELLATPAGRAQIVELLSRGPGAGLLSSPPSGPATQSELVPAQGRVDFPSDVDLALAQAGLSVTAAPTQARAIRLSVVHGDITHVDVPVMVAAYDGTPLRGAEHVLDRRFGGALSARAALGQLAGPLGTCDVIRRPDGTGTAVIIGIGNPGELTPGQLTASVTQAVLELVLAQRDNGALAAGQGLTVASVLMGTSGNDAISVQPSLAAIARGVHHANRRLFDVRDQVGGAWVESLQIVELYEDRAVEAAQAAIRLAGERQPEGAVLAAERFLVEGCNGRPGLPPPDYSSGQWRTIRVAVAPHQGDVDDDLVALSFTSLGSAARAEQRITQAQRRILDRLIDEGIDQPQADPQLYNTLYELLLPPSMKGQGPATENVMFVVDGVASTIPFELLATRGSQESPLPLAVETGMLRRLETTSYRESARPAAGARALVIGDPAGVRPRLPGARLEARRVAAKLAERGFQVTSLVSESDDDESVTITRIMNALFEHDYRIIHIAAHGTYESESVNGILIGDGALLTAHEVRQMRATPDLVFLNACHVGSVILRRGGGPQPGGQPLNAPGKMASSLARQLIDDGVRGVVAAAWAVDDTAAAAFAERFYDDLLGAYDLGEAAKNARSAIYVQHPQVNTWGAYQVYGPPAMRINLGGPTYRQGRTTISRKQFRDDLRSLRRRADDAPRDEWPALVADLEGTLAGAPARWRGGAELEAEAGVWLSLDEHTKAIECYRQALDAWEGRAPLSLVEQLVEATIQHARRPDQAGPHDLWASADALIEALLQLRGAAPDVLAIRGAALWRRATSGDRPSWSRLREAAEAFEQATRGHEARTGTPGYRYGPTWAVLSWLVQRRGQTAPDTHALVAVIDACASDATEQRCPDFRCRAAAAEAALARALVTGTLREQADLIIEDYHRVFAEGSTRRERLGVTEQVELVLSCLSPTKDADTRAALEALGRELAAWGAAPDGRAEGGA
jgi:CHAT domain-containing protein